MSRCRAHLCPELADPEASDAVFCRAHWRLLLERIWDDGQSMAAWLCTAWRTSYWTLAVEACARALRAIEAERELRDAPW